MIIIARLLLVLSKMATCNACGGTGQVIDKPCPDCHGKGSVKRLLRKSIFRQGVDGSGIIPIRGGRASLNCKWRSVRRSVCVIINVKSHTRFTRDVVGDHISDDAYFTYDGQFSVTRLKFRVFQRDIFVHTGSRNSGGFSFLG